MIKNLIIDYMNKVQLIFQNHKATIIVICTFIIAPLFVLYIWNIYTNYRDNKALRANLIVSLNEAGKMLEKNLFKEALDCYKRIEKNVSKSKFPDLYGHIKYKMSHCLAELAYDGNRESNLLLAINLDEEALTVLKKMVFTDQIELLRGLSTLYLALSNIKETEKYQNMASSILGKLVNDSSSKDFEKDPLSLRLLGDLYRTLAQIKNPEENYEKAINAYKEALKIVNVDNEPLTFAIIQNNLGSTYRELAEIKFPDRAKNLISAMEAFQEALKVCTIESYPVRYATNINNIGLTYFNLADIQKKEENLDKAIEYYHKALHIRSKDKYPFEYATTINNIASALIKCDSGTNQDKKNRLHEAITLFHEASEIRNIVNYPLDYAKTQNNLGGAYLLLAAIEEKELNLKNAKFSLESALPILTIEKYPFFYARITKHLGLVYGAMSMFKDPYENKKKAISSFKKSLKVITIHTEPTIFADIHDKIFNLLYHHYKRFQREEDKVLAVEMYEKAIEGYKIVKNDIGLKNIQKKINEINTINSNSSTK